MGWVEVSVSDDTRGAWSLSLKRLSSARLDIAVMPITSAISNRFGVDVMEV